ncbi:MAG: class I SAM-dependent methyltransferase [Planctomycetes bacterium]|nr:class I SAM-dependent methyltransferase [Planctomycetota bacterium]
MTEPSAPTQEGPSPVDWARIHAADESWRKKLLGGINDAFVVPRYVKLFYDNFRGVKDWDLCEIGSGNGDMSRAILAANAGQVRRYVVSEYFAEGVEWLRKLGLDAVQADAQALPWKDAEFDASVEFDVMHHVDRPRDMARELMRVARGRVLLVESNGLSIFRKLKELTPAHRAAGERSYTPWGYRGFFEGHAGYEVTRFTLFPFLFPFKVPRPVLPALVAFNRAIEQVPLFRWTCSSVAIAVEYRRVGGTAAGPATPSGGAWREEPAEWQETYFDEAEVRKRRARMPGKLRALGLGEADRGGRVLDLCCGGGEALEALHDLGFRDLHGVDVTLSERLRADPRFQVKAGDVRKLELPDASVDFVLLLHSLHHMETVENVSLLLDEAWRVLRPGGRFGIVDFGNTLPIRLAFWVFRHDALLWTRGMRRFGRIIQSEWRFLKDYLPRWGEVEKLLYRGRWEVASRRPGLFYFKLVLGKPRG